MKLQKQETKDNLLARLKRIEGQVRGLQNMILEERECREILQQMTAVRSAIQSASVAVMQDYASNCLLEMNTGKQEERETLVNDLIAVISKTS